MGRNQRRRAQQRQQNWQQPAPGGGLTLDEVIGIACRVAHGPEADKVLFSRMMANLHVFEAQADPLDRPSARVQQVLAALTTSILDGGWQPADLVHVVRREWTLRASKLITSFIAEHSRTHDAPARAPHVWVGQLVELGVVNPERTAVIGGRGDHLAAWARAERLHPEDALSGAVQVLAQVRMLPRLPTVVTPPSKWGATNRGIERTERSSDQIDAKALKLIRALLAKAEGTTFDAEAEAFTAKAQELMTRHSIDAAVLASSAEGSHHATGVESRRVHIDNPYAEEKAGFLAAIGEVNGVKCVWVPYAGLCTAMGFPVDLQLTDLLFTSLLVQATRASAAATAGNRQLSTASFRRAFLVAFADRIAERLEAARSHTRAEAAQEYGDSLLPVLASREAAVEAAYAEAFPNATTMRSRSLNAAGWYAGRAAADAADIGAGGALPAG